MTEQLFNIREAAAYLGIGERLLKEMVDSGKLPAYKIGGTFLRFKESQLLIAKSAIKREEETETPAVTEVSESGLMREKVRDFIYYNDFYILSVVVIFIAVALMLAT